MNQITTRNGQPTAAVVENVVIRGDLSKLNDSQRTEYYYAVCKSVGLNPLTRPFEYIVLNGKLTLYALRNCTDQLRQIHNVSVLDMAEGERDGVYIVTCKVQNGDGRTDMAKGAVNIANLKGEALANALMKTETKAKRRATLSICGLSLLDETEVEDIPAPAKRENPHITRPEDIVDVPENIDPADTIPGGNPAIAPLPKGQTRGLYERLQKEMNAINDESKLKHWGQLNKDQIQLFDSVWQKTFRRLYTAHLHGLRNTQTLEAPPKQAAPPPQKDPEAESPTEVAERILSQVTDPDRLMEVWDYQVEPLLDEMPTDTMEELYAIYRKHEQRLSP